MLTIAVATCLPAQADGLQSRVQAALERARPVLLQYLDHALGGRLALVCLAAVHDEVPPDNRVFAGAMRRLASAELRDTYDLALRLMVMAEYPDFPDREKLARVDLHMLLNNRFRGGFTYNPDSRDRWDLSNTQYGALGLRAGESLGFDIPDRTWSDLLRAVASLQSPDGGFGYAGAGAPYSSMTAAGIAVLQICQQYLEDRVPTSLNVDNRLKAAWSWMDRNVRDIGNPSTRQSYYFHYGLERAAILSDVVHVSAKDWYEMGAEMFLERQGSDGGWGPAPSGREAPAELVSTSFAVLFLRRKFQRILVPITPGGGLGISQLDDDSSDADIREVVERELAKGFHVIPNMLKEMRSEVVARRKAAALVVFRLSGNAFGFNPYRDAEHNREAIKAAELWWLKSRGSGDKRQPVPL